MICNYCVIFIEGCFDGKDGVILKLISYFDGKGVFIYDFNKIFFEEIISIIN